MFESTFNFESQRLLTFTGWKYLLTFDMSLTHFQGFFVYVHDKCFDHNFLVIDAN